MEDINNLLNNSSSTIRNELYNSETSLKNVNEEYIKKDEFYNEIKNINTNLNNKLENL